MFASVVKSKCFLWRCHRTAHRLMSSADISSFETYLPQSQDMYLQSRFYSDEPLPHSASIRGPYVNSGSKDVGMDLSDHNPYIRYQKEQQRQKAEQ
jgi:hypothetical protein